MEDVRRTHGIIGARAKGMRDLLAQTETAASATEVFLSEVRDLDYAEAATLFQQAQVGLQASMLTGSQVMNLSLMDFLR
jgi:flagellin-like hook-associated protein FlgL